MRCTSASRTDRPYACAMPPDEQCPVAVLSLVKAWQSLPSVLRAVWTRDSIMIEVPKAAFCRFEARTVPSPPFSCDIVRWPQRPEKQGFDAQKGPRGAGPFLFLVPLSSELALPLSACFQYGHTFSQKPLVDQASLGPASTSRANLLDSCHQAFHCIHTFSPATSAKLVQTAVFSSLPP